MGVEKEARNFHIANLAAQGISINEIAKRLNLHRNTVSRRLKRPQTQQFMAALMQEVAQLTTAQTAERLEAARQAAQEERGRKRALHQGQGAPYSSAHNPLDAHAPIERFLAKQH